MTSHYLNASIAGTPWQGKELSATARALHGLTITGRQLCVSSDEAPKRIILAVGPIDGKRLYRDLLPRFPAALGGWQG